MKQEVKVSFYLKRNEEKEDGSCPAPKQKYIPRDELNRLMTTPLSNPAHYLIRDLFLFSCYTGISYGDMRRLSDEHIVTAPDGSQWIEMKRKKTGTDVRVRLMEVPLRIIEKYRPERKDKLIHELGDLCGIEGLHYHQSRHNFGTHITLSMGVPIESVSKMMGHTRRSTTEIYAKVTDRKIEEDMRGLRARTAGKTVSLHEDAGLRAAICFPGAKPTNNKTQTTIVL